MIKQNANFRVWVCLMLSVNLIEQNSVIKEKILNLDNSIDKVINLWLVDFMLLGSQKSYYSGILTQAIQVFTWIYN